MAENASRSYVVEMENSGAVRLDEAGALQRAKVARSFHDATRTLAESGGSGKAVFGVAGQRGGNSGTIKETVFVLPVAPCGAAH